MSIINVVCGMQSSEPRFSRLMSVKFAFLRICLTQHLHSIMMASVYKKAVLQKKW